MRFVIHTKFHVCFVFDFAAMIEIEFRSIYKIPLLEIELDIVGRRLRNECYRTIEVL